MAAIITAHFASRGWRGGAGRSQALEEVIADVGQALAGGGREVVLTGVHLGSWGQDFVPAARLADLIQAVLNQTTVERLRLSSLEPWDLSEDFFELWHNPRLCRHLHLPLQSGSAATLRRMARKTTPESFLRLVELARQVQPEMAITTDVIVGFPGESEAEFAESLATVSRVNFAGGHVFSYSARPGTPAARLPNQVPMPLRKERSREMRAVLGESARQYQQRFLGRQVQVLWEGTSSFGPQGWKLEGLSDNYLRVTAFSAEKLWNQVSRVEIKSLAGEELSGEIISC
jgi:threonylcarbamoyladenosine tRNA methylthiotransferase MtaB